MQAFWPLVDRIWIKLASVKLTIVILIALVLLTIPGMVILQVNISNVDPGLQYSKEFWDLGNALQLFTTYHSFWYVGLIVILSLNLIACSVERWPQMYKLATAKFVAWAPETFDRHPENFKREWSTRSELNVAKEQILAALKRSWVKPEIILDTTHEVQMAFQTGRWSRVANYLVHTSLLVIFLGAIISSLYGFEGAANIPKGQYVDSFLIFKEGRLAGLKPVRPGSDDNTRFLGFRLRADDFQVKFWDNWPGRPKEFVSTLSAYDPVSRQVMATKTIRVNDPFVFNNYVFYQASYGALNDFLVKYLVVDKKRTKETGQLESKLAQTTLGELNEIPEYKLRYTALNAVADYKGLGPAVQFQEVEGEKLKGEPFWTFIDAPIVDLQRDSRFGFVVQSVERLYYTGLQIGYDPGAPVYWAGCLGLLIGTFYALFVTHKRYQIRIRKSGKVLLAGSIHRLPTGFEKSIEAWATKLQKVT